MKRSSRTSGNSVFQSLPRNGRTWIRFGLFVLGYALLLMVQNALIHGCPYQVFLHVPCPGCGMTRALLSFLRGQFATAFRYHFMFPFVPLLFYLILQDGKVFRNQRWNTVLLLLLGAGFLLRWVLNLTEILPA